MQLIWGRPMRYFVGLIFISFFLLAMALAGMALARDLTGQYANSPLHDWFDHLANKKHDICCSVADGHPVGNDDWGTRGGRYWVRVEGEVVDVPDDALVEGQNRAERAMEWHGYLNGHPNIRCFMPGTMT